MESQGCEKEDDLEQVMRRLAAGDEAAVVTLYERHGSSIAAAVRYVARSRPGRLDDDDVGGAVLDVCFELARVAGGWSPEGGALPWVWARHRVASAVDRALGQQAQSLDDQRSEVLDRLAAAAVPGPAPGAARPEPSLLDTLNRLAAEDELSRRPTLVDANAVPATHARSGQLSVVGARRVSGPDDSSDPGSPDPGSAGAGPAAPESAGAGWATPGPCAGGSEGDPAPVDRALGRAWAEAHSRRPGAGAPEQIDLTESADRADRESPDESADRADRESPDASVGVGLLAEAMDRGGVSIRDRELLLEYAYEKHSGNGAPAASVAPMFDMREVSVRQAARRTRERLLRLAASEERFAPLADLPLLA